jgi:hypothetical protein
MSGSGSGSESGLGWDIFKPLPEVPNFSIGDISRPLSQATIRPGDYATTTTTTTITALEEQAQTQLQVQIFDGDDEVQGQSPLNSQIQVQIPGQRQAGARGQLQVPGQAQAWAREQGRVQGQTQGQTQRQGQGQEQDQDQEDQEETQSQYRETVYHTPLQYNRLSLMSTDYQPSIPEMPGAWYSSESSRKKKFPRIQW